MNVLLMKLPSISHCCGGMAGLLALAARLSGIGLRQHWHSACIWSGGQEYWGGAGRVLGPAPSAAAPVMLEASPVDGPEQTKASEHGIQASQIHKSMKIVEFKKKNYLPNPDLDAYFTSTLSRLYTNMCTLLQS